MHIKYVIQEIVVFITSLTLDLDYTCVYICVCIYLYMEQSFYICKKMREA